jgi:hypothetical protein
MRFIEFRAALPLPNYIIKCSNKALCKYGEVNISNNKLPITVEEKNKYSGGCSKINRLSF